jgi:hypothetical protein
VKSFHVSNLEGTSVVLMFQNQKVLISFYIPSLEGNNVVLMFLI